MPFPLATQADMEPFDLLDEALNYIDELEDDGERERR